MLPSSDEKSHSKNSPHKPLPPNPDPEDEDFISLGPNKSSGE
jgi:hypothetical protein